MTSFPRTNPPPTGAAPRNAPTNLGGRLAIEWARLRVRPSALRRAARWGIVDRAPRDLDEILAAVGYEVEPTEAAEQRLRELVLLAANDVVAARVVIQRILPGLLAVVGRRRRQGFGTDVLEELLGAAWIAIRTFNPDRRPACMAAALISDADYRAFRASRRRRSSNERPTDLSNNGDLALPVAAINAVDELAELFALAMQSGIPDDDIDLLRQLLGDASVSDLARDMAVTPRTIRNRRARIALKLRGVALAA